MAKELYFENQADARKHKIKTILRLILLYAFLVFFALFTLIPFYWMINVSLWSDATMTQNIIYGTNFFPSSATLDNFREIFTNDIYRQIFVFMLYTLINGIFSTILSVIVTVLAAFAFARLNFKGKEILFVIFLITMMIPNELLIITNYTTAASLGWLDQFIGLILPGIGSVFFMFFLRQTFKQVPDELYYASKVDGNSDFNYFLKVMVPIAKPTIITITILSLIGSWNAFIWPRTVNRTHTLVTEGLTYLFFSEVGDNSNLVMAAALMVSLPLLLVFIIFRKFIMNGVSRSGIKG